MTAILNSPYFFAGALVFAFLLGVGLGWWMHGDDNKHRHGSGDLIDEKNPDEDLM